jgi:ubiquinone biosynthesis protein UbiJ
VVCYGFLILALALHWPNEANTYLLFFCLSNGILAVVSAFKPKADCDLCRWIGILSKLKSHKAIARFYSEC